MFEAIINLNLSIRPVEGGNISCTSRGWRGLGGEPLLPIDLVLSKNLGPVLTRAHPSPVRQLHNLVRAAQGSGISARVS